MPLAPFDGPRLKIERAQKHVAELREVLDGFAKTVGYAMEPCAVTDLHTTYVFRFAESPPREVPVIIGDAVHNLRAALDIMICDIARVRSKSSNQLKFPFAPNIGTLEQIISKNLKRLGADVVEAVLALRPYQGGNLALRALHDLDIDDKHETIIPYYLIACGKMNPFIADLIKSNGGIDFSQAVAPLIEGRSTSMVLHGANPWDAVHPQPGVPPVPVFDAKSPFAGEPVFEVLDRLVLMVDQIVNNFEIKFGVEAAAK